MFSCLERSRAALCDRYPRREFLRAGSLAAWAMSHGLSAVAAPTDARTPMPRAKRCIVLFLMGGPPQHSLWDPKPHAPQEVRGAYGAMATAVPGLHLGELLPETARLTDHMALLRAVSTGDNAHSSSGYAMLTGQPHAPLNFENANPGPPNDWPTLGSVVQHLHASHGHPSHGLMPTAVRLPHQIFNTDLSVWPGQDAGWLGASANPWLFRCEPHAKQFQVTDFQLADQLPVARLVGRRNLLQQLDQQIRHLEQHQVVDAYQGQQHQAFDLLSNVQSKRAFDLEGEPDVVRDRYGRNPFGQSVLLARKLVESGVQFVHVNWFRGVDEPSDNPCWDSHVDEAARLKNALVPPFDRAYSALLRDLIDRRLLEDTLVVCMAEFGRSPRINGRGGRDHWGHVFSVALAGGGIQGGAVYGSSDASAAYPQSGLVRPQDLTATILHCLGYAPHTEIRDREGRPVPISRGTPIGEILT